MSVFGVTPTQIAVIAGGWSARGGQLAGTDLTQPAPQSGCQSTVTGARVSAAIETATRLVGTELIDLGAALGWFDAETTASDQTSAQRLASVHGVQ